MKRILFLLVVLAMALTVVACGKSAKVDTTNAGSTSSEKTNQLKDEKPNKTDKGEEPKETDEDENVTEKDIYKHYGDSSEYNITESDASELYEEQESLEETDSSKDESTETTSSKPESTTSKNESTTSKTESTTSKNENGSKDNYDVDGDGWTDGWN